MGNGADDVTNPGGVSITAFSVRRVPPGIQQINLLETLEPGPGGSSLLRADAQVVWYPPRSAAEYLVAARFRSVRITLTRITLTGSNRTGSVHGGQRIIRPLAAVLDSMHAASPLMSPCPMPPLQYTLVFAPAVPAQQAVIVTSFYCGKVQVSVGDRPQPELFDSGRLSALVTQLFYQYAPVHSSR